MFTLFARRVAAARTAPSITTARSALSIPTTQAFAVRRTFLTSVSVREPAKVTTASKATTSGTKTSVKKVPSKAAAPKKAAPKKKAAPQKKPVAKKATPKSKPKKVAPPKLKITAEDKPPKQPLHSYLIFASKYRAGKPAVTTLPEAQALAKETAATWRALTEHEKQAFRDEYLVLREEYMKRREEYFAKVDPAKLKLLNQQRQRAGKPRVNAPRKEGVERRPLTGFFRFMAEFRQKNTSLAMLDSAKEAGAAWRALSESQKKPYTEAAAKELAEYAAKKKVAST